MSRRGTCNSAATRVGKNQNLLPITAVASTLLEAFPSGSSSPCACINTALRSTTFGMASGFQPYGDYSAALGRCDPATFNSRVTNILSSAPNWNLYISEFNVDGGDINRWTAIETQSSAALAEEMYQKYILLESLGYQDIYPFLWSYQAGSERWSMKKLDGSYAKFMPIMVTGQRSPYLVNLH